MSEFNITSQLVSIDGNMPKTTSIAVAQFFGKRHADVLRAIDKIDCSDDFRQRNFALVMESMTYTDKNGSAKTKATKRVASCNMTKDGFMFLVMGFTGKKAALLKEAYIKEFNRMADVINGNIGSLIQRLDIKTAMLKKGEAIAGDCGYNLRLYGQVVNPNIKLEIAALQAEMQPLLPFDDI